MAREFTCTAVLIPKKCKNQKVTLYSTPSVLNEGVPLLLMSAKFNTAQVIYFYCSKTNLCVLCPCACAYVCVCVRLRVRVRACMEESLCRLHKEIFSKLFFF